MLDVELVSRLKANCPYLTELGLAGCDLNSAGLCYVAELLRKNSCVTSLDLTNNNIQDRGIAALVHMLQRNTTIRTVLLGGNCFGDEAIRSLAVVAGEKGIRISVVPGFILVDGGDIILQVPNFFCRENFKI